jgi:hypothetical protein
MAPSLHVHAVNNNVKDALQLSNPLTKIELEVRLPAILHASLHATGVFLSRSVGRGGFPREPKP